MIRASYVLFGGVAYLIFFATFLYLIAFIGNAPFVSRTIDNGPEAEIMIAAVIDIGLIALFGLQHSIMARQGFKAAWTRIVPPPIERATYVLASSAVLLLLFHSWRPIPIIVWSVDNAIGAGVLWALFAAGWGIVLLSTFLLSHFELFGLKQVWQNFKGSRADAPQFRLPLLYKLVRHPLYSGFLLAFWATPVMSVGHLLFALGMTVYIVVAISYEEKDLVDLFGADYENYRERVGMLTPKF